MPDPLPPASDVNEKVSKPIAKVLTEAMALSADDRPQTAARMRELLNEATRLSIVPGKTEVVSEAPIKASSYESTLPFPADQVPKERKSATDDLSDDARTFVETVRGMSIEMVLVPDGTFMMGTMGSPEAGFLAVKARSIRSQCVVLHGQVLSDATTMEGYCDGAA